MAKIRNLRELTVKLNRISAATEREARKALQRGALAIENSAVKGIVSSGSSNNPGPSKPGEFPAAKTGRLHQSITTVDASDANRIRFETGSNVDYGTFLELGTSKMAPRPFLQPAFRSNVDKIKANVRAAIKRAVRTGAR